MDEIVEMNGHFAHLDCARELWGDAEIADWTSGKRYTADDLEDGVFACPGCCEVFHN